LDAIVWQWVLTQFENPEIVRRKYEQWLTERDAGGGLERDERDAAIELLEAAEKRRKNYMRLAGSEDDIAQAEEYRLMAREAADAARSFSERIDQLNSILEHQEQQQTEVEAFIAAAERKAQNLANANFNDKRYVLYAFQIKVTLYPLNDRKHEPYYIGWFEDQAKKGDLDFTATSG
jgi:hypothetical protein